MGMKVRRDSVESEEFEGRILQKGCCGMSKTEERLSEENSVSEQDHGGRGGNVFKGECHQQLLHIREREERYRQKNPTRFGKLRDHWYQ